MLNQAVVIGRVYKELENDVIVLAVPKVYKNDEGIYETDYLPVMVYGNVADNVKKYCSNGTLVGIKGRLEIKDNTLIVVADRVTFLSNESEKINDETKTNKNEED